MKKNMSYKNALFEANNVLTAFNVKLKDNYFVLGLSVSNDVLLYAEEEIISFCVTRAQKIDVLPYITRIEIHIDRYGVYMAVVVSKKVSNEERNQILETFDGKLCPPIREIQERTSLRTEIEFLPSSFLPPVKYRKTTDGK